MFIDLPNLIYPKVRIATIVVAPFTGYKFVAKLESLRICKSWLWL